MKAFATWTPVSARTVKRQQAGRTADVTAGAVHQVRYISGEWQMYDEVPRKERPLNDRQLAAQALLKTFFIRNEMIAP